MTHTLPVAIVIPLVMVDQDGIEILLQKRETTGILNGTWEFPGGKIESGETPVDAAKREFLEEVGMSIDNIDLNIFNLYPFEYESFKVNLFTYIAYSINGFNKVESKLKRVRINFNQNIDNIEMELPPANYKILSDLLIYIKEQKISGDWEKLWEM